MKCFLQMHILNQENCDAVIPKTERGLEPLHAIYGRETCLHAVEAAIQADKWRMISWHEDVDIQQLSYERIHLLDPNGLAFWNLNTPDDVRQAEELAGQQDQ